MEWSKYPNFRAEEFKDPNHIGSGDLINERVVYLLQELRDRMGCRLIIHRHVGGAVDVDGSWGHSKSSYHLKANGCCAVDFHIETSTPHREQTHYVIGSGFSGIGMYYWWKNGTSFLPVGFHCDLRPTDRTQLWVSLGRGNYKYLLP